MRRIFISIIIVLLPVFCLAELSCTRQDASKSQAEKTAPESTPDNEKRAEEIGKGSEEARKIVVARVNGEDITMDSLIHEMNRIAPQYVKPGQATTSAIDEKVKHEALDMIVFHELAIQEAERQGIRPRPETVEAVVKELKSRLGSDEAYQRYLVVRGLSESEMRKKIERNRQFELITDKEIYQKIHVDEKMLREEYRKNKDQIKTKTEPTRPMSYEEAKPLMERKIKMEIGEAKMREWDMELRKKAKVEIMLAEAEKRLKPVVPENKR